MEMLTSGAIDVGGGHQSDFSTASASHIPLRWMLKEARLHTNIIFHPGALKNYGLDPTYFPSEATIANPHKDTELAAGYYDGACKNSELIPKTRAGDVRAPLHDLLFSFSLLWWFLEFLPILERKQAADDSWLWRPQYVALDFFQALALISLLLSLNLFRPRTIPRPGPGQDGTQDPKFTALVHRSVLERMSLRDSEVMTRRGKSLYLKKEPYQPYALHDEITPIWVE